MIYGYTAMHPLGSLDLHKPKQSGALSSQASQPDMARFSVPLSLSFGNSTSSKWKWRESSIPAYRIIYCTDRTFDVLSSFPHIFPGFFPWNDGEFPSETQVSAPTASVSASPTVWTSPWKRLSTWGAPSEEVWRCGRSMNDRLKQTCKWYIYIYIYVYKYIYI